MSIIGKVEILDSYYVTNRGLVARCNLLEGKVKNGCLVNLDLGGRKIMIRVDSVEMMDNISTGEYWVGLLFNYKGDPVKNELISVKLPYQVVDIIEEY